MNKENKEMAKYNTKSVSKNKTTNKEGGIAYKMNPKAELASLMTTAFLAGDKFYETEQGSVNRFENLFKELLSYDKLFLAKASLYARDKFNMRSISHLCSAMLMESVVNNEWTDVEERHKLQNYFSKVIMRPDDMSETIAAYAARPNAYHTKAGKLQIPQVAKKGFSRAIASYDEYRMSKYRMSDKEYSLIDIIRMTHAKATTKNKTALEKLVKDTLRAETTWEATLSKAGKAGDKEAVTKATAEAWDNFVAKGNKIEYFALLRNLRNIAEQASMETLEKALSLLTAPNLIQRSKVLPFRYLSAYDAIKEASLSVAKERKVFSALNKAVETSLSNVPKFDGTTAVFVDISGSMCSRVANTHLSYAKVAALFAAVLYKTNDAVVVKFDEYAKIPKLNPDDSVMTITEKIAEATGGWTCIEPAFQILSKKNITANRIVILSDMQAWTHESNTTRMLKNYESSVNIKDVKVFSFDLSGYGTQLFSEGQVHLCSGYSDHSFDILAKLEEDKDALVHEIEAIEL